MLLNAFTLFHVLLSLAGIGSGLIVVYGMLASKRLESWTSFFLITTMATSVTGFMFPFTEFLPSHALGIVSVIVTAIAIFARRSLLTAGRWRRTFAVSSVIALYLNVFVLIVQLFRKVPSLNALAPTQTESPFQITQLVVLTIFAVIAIRAPMKFRGVAAHTP